MAAKAGQKEQADPTDPATKAPAPPVDDADIEGPLTAISRARQNGTVMDGSNGAHVMGFGPSDEQRERIAQRSRERADEAAAVQSDED